jgi:hypothetical protein
MTTTSDPWFVTERSEALARVWLTNRPDVRVRSERRLDDRLLLYVEIGTGDPLSAQHFVVQVKGTLSAPGLPAGVRVHGERAGEHGLVRLGCGTAGRREQPHVAHAVAAGLPPARRRCGRWNC